MGMNAAQRRAAFSDRSIYVYGADTSRGWRIVQVVTPESAYKKVMEGKCSELFDDLGNFLGVQILAAVKTDQDLPSGTSTTTITARDVLYFVGGGGKSRTIGMSEDRRITRYSPVTCKALPPEDRVERVIAKVQQWPFPASRIDSGRGPVKFGDRATRVYPRYLK